MSIENVKVWNSRWSLWHGKYTKSTSFSHYWWLLRTLFWYHLYEKNRKTVEKHPLGSKGMEVKDTRPTLTKVRDRVLNRLLDSVQSSVRNLWITLIILLSRETRSLLFHHSTFIPDVFHILVHPSHGLFLRLGSLSSRLRITQVHSWTYVGTDFSEMKDLKNYYTG